MKKLLCIILCMLVVGSLFFTVTATADNSDKYNADLKTIMESASDDEVVAVWVWLNYAISDQELEEKTFEKCGLTQDTLSVDYSKYETVEEARKAEKEKVKLWRDTRNNIITEFYDGVNNAFIDKANIKNEQVVFSSLSSASFVADLPVVKIRELSTSKEVVSLHLYTEEILPPPTDNTVPETEPTYPFNHPLPEGNLYEDELVERLGIADNTDGGASYWYEELLRYYEGMVIYSPDYVLIKASKPYVSDEYVSSYFGDYFIVTSNYTPYKHAYFIYNPMSNELFTLEEAYAAEVKGLEDALEFLNGTSIAMVGDADANFKLNIKDATWIQKSIANYSDLTGGHEVEELAKGACDYNRDGNINIKDATSIQKCLAKIEI